MSSAFAVAIFFAACGGDGNGGGGGTDITTGTITVTVTADGAAKSGVTVRRFAVGSQTSSGSAQTGANGQATFSNVEAGAWEVEVTVPNGFELQQGEPNRKSVTVTAGGIATASFPLVDLFQGVTVNATDNLSFSQPNLVVAAGTAVRWVNTGSMLHTVTPDGHAEWSSANLSSTGSSFTHTFNTPGTYDYFCQPHVGQGMTGTVTVN